MGIPDRIRCGEGEAVSISHLFAISHQKFFDFPPPLSFLWDSREESLGERRDGNIITTLIVGGVSLQGVNPENEKPSFCIFPCGYKALLLVC